MTVSGHQDQLSQHVLHQNKTRAREKQRDKTRVGEACALGWCTDVLVPASKTTQAQVCAVFVVAVHFQLKQN